MKTMIFSGRTMREAMAQAKQRFGADIDILNSDQVGDEVQVTVVVPEASGAGRRRKAVDRVSAGIKALADAPMKGERSRGAVKQGETVAGASDEAVAGAVGELQPDGGTEESVAGKSNARTTRAGKATKTSRAGKTATTRKSTRGARGAADGARGQDESPADQEPRPAGRTGAVAPETVSGSSGPDTAEPVSTLDFERLRRQQQGRTAAQPAAVSGGEAAAPSQAASLVQALVAAQRVRVAPGAPPPETEPVQGGSTRSTAVAASPTAVAVTPATAGGWRTAGQAVDTSAGRASASSAASAASADGSGAEAGASGSRLSVVLNSARRMLSHAPGRWLGARGTVAPAAAPPELAVPPSAEASRRGAEESVPGTGFAQEPPMPLSSLLQAGASEWPSLSLQSEEVPDPASGQGGAPMIGGAPDRVAVHAMSADPARSRESRLAGIGWFETARRRPAQMRLLRNLLSCQFSPALARTLVSLLPVDYSDVQADEWLRQMMLRALAGVNGRAGILPGHTEQTIFDRGGIFALIGPTGVGKTTSIAKIAAHHVLRHGPKSLALITADVYRIGAQEQLRAFGKMLGVPVQVAQDREVLQGLLKEHEDRSLVLIDTAGISQRDERVSQLTSALALADVKRVLVLNAGTQPGGIEDVLRAFGASETAGVLLSKVDEAVGLGACFDALIRHRLPLVGYTDGQRVPEDYHPANLGQLIESALSGEAANQYPSLSMTDSEIRHLFEGAHV